MAVLSLVLLGSPVALARGGEVCNGIDDDGDPTTTDAGLITLNGVQNFATIPAALAATVTGDTVAVCAGLYPGSFVVDRSITLVAPEGPRNTVLQGNGSGPVLIAAVNVPPNSFLPRAVVVQGFTIVGAPGGHTIPPRPPPSPQIGVRVDGRTSLLMSDAIVKGHGLRGVVVGVDATATITGSAIENNGGGLRAEAFTTVDLTGTSVAGNVATEGGGVSLGAGASLIGGSITGNSADRGGGLWLDEGASVTGATLIGNDADRGGGVYAFPDARVASSDVGFNTATDGGGLVATTILGGGQLELADVDVHDNVATTSGGGVFAETDGIGTLNSATLLLDAATVIRSNSAYYGGGIATFGDVGGGGALVTDNFANTGGGIELFQDGATLVWLSDLVVVGNTAEVSGGGIEVDLSSTSGGTAFPSLLGSTITGNDADFGGGLNLYGSPAAGDLLWLGDTEISDNSAAVGGGAYVFRSTLTMVGAVLDSNAGGALELLSAAAGCYGGAITRHAVTAVESSGSTFTSFECDFGTGPTANLPFDVHIVGQAFGHHDYVGVSTFDCDTTTCF